MTSRERIAALVAGEPPDRVALFEHFWGETLREAWPAQGYPAGAAPGDVFGYDLKPLGWSVNTTPFMRPEEELERTERHRLVRNGRGAVLRYWNHKSGTPEHVGFDCVTPEKWAVYREPLLGFDPARINKPDELRQALALAAVDNRFSVLGGLFVFELLRATLGDVCMLESLLLEPAWIHDFCRVYTDLYKAHYGWIFDTLGKPDGMFIYEDLGFSNGLFCSPSTYDELILPYHQELVDFFHSYRLPVILHTCGDVRQVFDRLVDTGWNCLQPMEAKAGNHVLEYADRVAERGLKLGFMGNIDVTVLNTGDRDQVRAEVLPKVQGMVARGAAYCFHSDHSIPPDVSYDTYCYALDLVAEHGVYRTAVV